MNILAVTWHFKDLTDRASKEIATNVLKLINSGGKITDQSLWDTDYQTWVDHGIGEYYPGHSLDVLIPTYGINIDSPEHYLVPGRGNSQLAVIKY